MMRPVSQKLGVDWDQLRALLAVSIRMDFREHRGTGSARRGMAPIFRTMIFYAIMGGFLAMSLVSKASPFLFSLLTLAYSNAMMAFAVILEFGNILLIPDDIDILTHRPIRSRTLFLAKMLNLLFYVFLMSTALCLVPSFLGILLNGSSGMFPLVFYPVAIMSNFTSASFVVLIYTGLMRKMSQERFKDILAYLQIGFTFILFLSYQMLPRMGEGVSRWGADVSASWLYGVPPAWFAGCVQVLLGKGRTLDAGLATMAVAATLVLALLAFRRISLQYAHHVADLQTSAGSEKSDRAFGVSPADDDLVTRLALRILRCPEAMIGFRWTSQMLKRDRSVKMGVYPVFGFPLAFVALSIINGEIVDPFVDVSFFSDNGMSTMVVFFIFFMIYFFIKGLESHREWEAAWVLYTAPLRSPGRLYRGVRLAVLLRLMLPFYMLLGILYCTQIPLGHGIKHTVTLLLFGLVAFSIVSLAVKEFPFSRKREKGERMQRFAFLFFVMPFFMFTLFLQRVAYRDSVAWWMMQAGLILLFVTMESMTVKRIDRRLLNKESF